jgi:hypothetical protein
MSPIGRALEILRNEGLFRLLHSTKNFGVNRTKRITNRFFWSRYNELQYWIKYQEAAPSPNKLIYINPSKVAYLLTPHYWKRVSEYTTHIRDGRWDKNYSDKKIIISGRHEGIDEPCLIPFSNFVFYKSCKDHFLKNIPWEETELYTLLLDNKHRYWSYYNSKANIRNTLEDLDTLYTSINNNGYLHQTEIGSSSLETLANSRYPDNYHEVVVNIGRDGELIFDDGRHRFVIAKILNISNIPVRVLVRHKKWQEVRNEIMKANSPEEELSMRARNHLGHPDLVDITPDYWL